MNVSLSEYSYFTQMTLTRQITALEDADNDFFLSASPTGNLRATRAACNQRAYLTDGGTQGRSATYRASRLKLR